MLYDMAHLWVALPVALALGLGCGRSTRGPSPTRASTGPWTLVSALLFLVGLALALLRVVPGRPGLFLETALLLAVAYAVGFGLVAATIGPQVPVVAASLSSVAYGSRTRQRVSYAEAASSDASVRTPMLVAALILSIVALLLAVLKRRRSPSRRRP